MKRFLMSHYRRLMPCLDGDGGGGGGSNAGGGNGGSGTGGTGGTGGSGGQGGAGGTGGAGTGGRTYSEEEANRIAEERSERAKNAALKSYFEQQGFTPEEVTQLLKDHKAKKDAEKTEAQREKERADKAEKEKSDVLSAANSRIARTEFKVAAQAAGVPADRLEAAVKLADLSDLTPDEKTGEIPATKLKAAVEATIKANPFLKGAAGTGGSGGVGGGANPGGGSSGSSMNDFIRKSAGR
jgi:alanyl-tRNA synthetase